VKLLIVAASLGVAVTPLTVIAQTSTPAADTLRSSITATVRDSLGYPVVAASVLITPGGYIYRTDSAGKFTARNVPPGALTIGLRKLGFAPLQSRLNLHIGVDLTLDLVMQRLPQMLAEVEVKAMRQCKRYDVDGILCRQEQYAGGFFMNRLEILEKAKEDFRTDMLLRDAPGFRRAIRDGRLIESTVGWRCFTRIIDGGFPYRYNPVPKPTDVYAIEIYQPPDIPLEYQHWYWQDIKMGRKSMKAPCTLVVMWSMAQAQRQLKRLSPPK
jgi:hypothetical protein